MLQQQKFDLEKQLESVTDELAKKQNELDQSFLNTKSDSDKISAELAKLQTKYDGLIRAIATTSKAIVEEQQKAEYDAKQAELDQRKSCVKGALKSLENATELTSKLISELDTVRKLNFMASFENNSEVENSIRGLVGKLANEFKLHGSLQMASTIKIPNSTDYDRLISHLRKY